MLLFLLLGCRLAKTGKDMPSDQTLAPSGDGAAKPPMVQPQRQAARISQSLDVTLTAEGLETGRSVLKLDYIAKPKPDGVSVPRCYEAITAKLILGKLTCAVDPSKSVEVFASQFDQVCFIENAAPKNLRLKPLELPGCTPLAKLEVYEHSPPIVVEVRPTAE